MTSLPELIRRARSMAVPARRTLLGITGAPGVGKSTLAHGIVDQVGETARLVGMDGFHLSQARLSELGRLDRMGAIDTFDAAGFLALVRRLRSPHQETIYAPGFSRDLEESIAGALPVEPDVALVVVEGNYLLLAEKPWSELRHLFDEIWYCERHEPTRVANLIARHRAHGKSEEEARRWALGPDQRNAAEVAKTRSRADLIAWLDGELVPGLSTPTGLSTAARGVQA